MLRRNLASEFVAGAYVFPGGSVDPEDRGPEALALCDGRDDAEASALLGVDSGGLAFWFAVLRECFEEAGVLVARRRATGGGPARMLEDLESADAARLAAYRRDLNAGRIGMVEICRREDLVLAADTVHYVSHWITPEVSPRRFDTRFFVTAAPHGQDRPPRRRRDHRVPLGQAARRAGPLLGRRDRAAASHRRELPDARRLRVERRGHRLGAHGHRGADRPARRRVHRRRPADLPAWRRRLRGRGRSRRIVAGFCRPGPPPAADGLTRPTGTDSLTGAD